LSGKTSLFLILPLLILVIGFTSNAYGQIINPITVTTDKSLYYEGETIVISGEVSEILEGYAVSLLITGPNGDTVSIDQLKVDSNKRFSTSETAGGSLYDEVGSGTYTVSVLYATANRTAETTFQYISSDTTQPENSIDARTNKSFYGNGDRVIVTGTIRDYVADLHSNISLTYRVYDPQGMYSSPLSSSFLNGGSGISNSPPVYSIVISPLIAPKNNWIG